VANLTPRQQVNRSRVEGLIGLAAPALDLVLTVGERISKAVAPGDDYVAIGPDAESFEAARSELLGASRSSRRGADDA
jgi:hypothetical protein